MEQPRFVDVLRAAGAIGPYLPKTGFYESASLGSLLGCRLFVKYENHHAIGSFKIRGCLNRMLELDPHERSKGVVTASQGNHGQGVAWGARLLGIDATVVVPVGANPDKIEAIRNFGGTVVEQGVDFEAANAAAWELSIEQCLTYIHPSEDPSIVAGHATVALEMFEDEPDLDVIVVPVGSGGLASGMGLVAKTLRPTCRVVGVQTRNIPAHIESRRVGGPTEVPPARTIAEGIAVRRPSPLPFAMVSRYVDDLVAVGEEEIARAIVLLLEKTHNLAEGAGAAALAGALRVKGSLRGKRVGIVLSGGNLAAGVFAGALAEALPVG